MHAVRIRNVTRGVDLAPNGETADNPWRRFLGLMGRRTLPDGYGLVIRPCNSIHMFFMHTPLDVLHCGATTPDGDPVLRILSGIKPWRVGPIVRGGKYVIELPAGTVARTNTQVGDVVTVEAFATEH